MSHVVFESPGVAHLIKLIYLLLEHDHVIFFMLVRTPRVFWEGISGSVEFA